LSLIDEVLKRLLHHVDKLLVLIKTDGDDVIQFVFEVYATHATKVNYTVHEHHFTLTLKESDYVSK